MNPYNQLPWRELVRNTAATAAEHSDNGEEFTTADALTAFGFGVALGGSSASLSTLTGPEGVPTSSTST